MKKYENINGVRYYVQRDGKGIYRGWGTAGYSLWEEPRIPRARTQEQAERNLALFAAKKGLREVPVQ